MKAFWAGLLGFILKMVDLSVSLDGDILSIVLELGSIKVLDLHLDLIKDNDEVASKAVKSARFTGSKFTSTRFK